MLMTHESTRTCHMLLRCPVYRVFTADLYQIMGNNNPDYKMNDGVMAALMVISLGCMTGSAIGLVIGAVLKKQKGEWAAMTRNEKTINIVLMAVCSLFCCAALAWYSLQTPLV
jgi:hypothetical protein